MLLNYPLSIKKILYESTRRSLTAGVSSLNRDKKEAMELEFLLFIVVIIEVLMLAFFLFTLMAFKYPPRPSNGAEPTYTRSEMFV